ncbi:hypothetical protein ACI8B_180311 [Acinetobacter proteolyticus]|uniref:Uncharacterized protein n=1 Tax=Acinetobacter proteolyticus TaxID=1776741 RepID=A0A653K4Q8_9GAMM|nr:hypothetical protein ACI8B_180311 [Acinetobacter proteolyticus]
MESYKNLFYRSNMELHTCMHADKLNADFLRDIKSLIDD